MLATMCPDIVFARLPVILTCGIVTALLGFILIKIEFHSHPLSVGSHAKKGIGYPMRVLISIVPSYTTHTPFKPFNASRVFFDRRFIFFVICKQRVNRRL